MVYNPSIPQPSDRLRISQSEILENFTELDNIFDVDHVKYSDITGDAGKHEASTFVNRTDKALVIPPATTSEELALFVKDDAAGIPRIFYQEPDSAGAGAQQQLSGNVKAPADNGINPLCGETSLAGGVGIKYGLISVPGSLTPTAFTYIGLGLRDFITDTYYINISSQTAALSSISKTGFSIKTTSGITTYFAAIGI